MLDSVLKPFAAAVLGGALVFLAVRGCAPVPPAPPPPVPKQPEPKPPEPPKPDVPKPDTPQAIARIQFGNAGCTTTIIGPRREDGRYWCLTAAHCVKSVGQRGTMRLLDGRTTGVQVVALDRTSDACWLVTDTNSEVFPFAYLAERSAQPGEAVWHAGYGVDRPGNREDGVVEALPDQNGQCRYRLSVSSGDSGGGICLNDKGEVLSPVCCTSRLSGVGSVWGASPESCRRLRPTVMVLDDWTPVEMPVRPEPAPAPALKKIQPKN